MTQMCSHQPGLFSIPNTTSARSSFSFSWWSQHGSSSCLKALSNLLSLKNNPQRFWLSWHSMTHHNDLSWHYWIWWAGSDKYLIALVRHMQTRKWEINLIKDSGPLVEFLQIQWFRVCKDLSFNVKDKLHLIQPVPPEKKPYLNVRGKRLHHQ